MLECSCLVVEDFLRDTEKYFTDTTDNTGSSLCQSDAVSILLAEASSSLLILAPLITAPDLESALFPHSILAYQLPQKCVLIKASSQKKKKPNPKNGHFSCKDNCPHVGCKMSHYHTKTL